MERGRETSSLVELGGLIAVAGRSENWCNLPQKRRVDGGLSCIVQKLAAVGGERSFAEACLNREGAPISAISGTPIGRPKLTSSGHLADQGKLLGCRLRPLLDECSRL